MKEPAYEDLDDAYAAWREIEDCLEEEQRKETMNETQLKIQAEQTEERSNTDPSAHQMAIAFGRIAWVAWSKSAKDDDVLQLAADVITFASSSLELSDNRIMDLVQEELDRRQ